MDDAFGAIAATGFLAIFAFPILLATSAISRAIWWGWRPRELASSIVEDGGGSPKLAGWIVVVVLGCLSLAWAMFQGTWLLERWTAFKPMPISFLMPIFAVATAIAAVLLSRPVATLVTAGFRKLDARWRRAGRTSLVTPWRIALATAVIAVGVTYTLWHFVVANRIGTLDLSPLVAPAAGLAATALVHLAWHRLSRARVYAGLALAAATAFALAAAIFAWRARPTLTLTIWGDRPLAGLVVDRLFDLDSIHDRIPTSEMRPAEHPGAEHPDIVLVTIDTVRADHTPPYNGTAEMPVLRELGAKGAVFEWAFSPSNVTRRSIPAMTIGMEANRVRGRVVGWALRIDPRYITIAERLAAGGYETAGFMCCYGIWGDENDTGLSRGLEHLEIEPHENGAALARMARVWLDAREKAGPRKPLFLWMHVIEPHNWHQGAGEPHTDEERRRYYDRALQISDSFLIQLLGAFSGRPPEKAPIVIVTADHGEGLGDHGQPYHSTDLYDSQIHVPLVIAGPGIKPERIPETVSLVDLAPTLLELAGFDPPAGAFDGRSFADLATGRRVGDSEQGTAFAAMIKDRSNPGGLAAVVRGRYKLIDNGSSAELYDIHVDPDERSNLLSVKPAVVEDLKKVLHKFIAKGDVGF
jgi:arylsulfatase A-like enzyme